MPKLLTPQQYEKPLDDLNELRPLQLADEVKHQIDIAVCDKLPVSTKKAVTGLLTKGTQQGSLLARLQREYPNYQLIEFVGTYPTLTYAPIFSQVVRFIISIPVSYINLHNIYWQTSGFINTILKLNRTSIGFIPFTGKIFRIRLHWAIADGCAYNLYGFY